MTYLEILFPKLAAPGDFEIITPASPAAPGLARLLAARVEPIGDSGSRVLSANGLKFFGFIASDDPLSPFENTYWLDTERVLDS